MATRIFLVRHGATELTAEDRFAGETNVPLSEEGRRQSRKLAERLRHESIVAVYTSPMDRTMETARIIGLPHGRPIVTRDALREISHGHWEGKKRADVEVEFPEEFQRWEQDPFTFAPPGGETGLALMARALPSFLDLVPRHPDSCVVVVSHKATIRLLISSILGFDARTYRDRLDQSAAALNILDFKDVTRGRLTLFNDTSHYSTEASGVPEVPAGRLSKWWDREEPGNEQ